MVASRLRWASPFDQNLESSALSKENDMCCTSFLRHWCRRRRCYNGQRFSLLFSRVSRNFFSVLWIFSHIFLSRFGFSVAGVLTSLTSTFAFISHPIGFKHLRTLLQVLTRKLAKTQKARLFLSFSMSMRQYPPAKNKQSMSIALNSVDSSQNTIKQSQKQSIPSHLNV